LISGLLCNKRVDEYGKLGYRYVLDADIKAFYDTIPHKLIMKQLCVKIADGWVLTSIENMLKAGIMENGSITYSDLGTPQGGVLSPLLANLVGDIMDKEFEAAGYKFVRYADDFIILTKTEEELQPALELVKEVVEKKLEMKLSPNKTELTNFRRGFKFLGYKFTGRYKRISDKSLGKIKDKIRSHTKRSQGVNLKAVIEKLNPLIVGNVNYFRFADAVGIFTKLDQWIRMRLRCFKFSRKWRSDNKRFKNQRFDKLGLKSYVDEFKRRRVLGIFSISEQLIGVANYEKYVWFKRKHNVVLCLWRRLGSSGSTSALPAQACKMKNCEGSGVLYLSYPLFFLTFRNLDTFRKCSL